MVLIYVLKLEDNKYYIGKTKNNIDNDVDIKRINDHFNNKGSDWTLKYKPIEIVETFNFSDDYDEDKYTLKYMGKYGIENVRGGSFCTIKLDDDTIKVIKRMLNGSNNKCYNCESNNHFVKNCPNISNNDILCYRCGRKGHFFDKCYAKTHVNNKSLYGCYNCGRDDHWKINCIYDNDIYGRKIQKSLLGKIFDFFNKK